MRRISIALSLLLFLTPKLFAANASEVLLSVGHGVMLATYSDLSIRGRELQTSVATLASQPTPENLAASQQAWRNMRANWESSEAFLFGPVSSLNIDPALDTWPVNIRDVENILASRLEISPHLVRDLGVNLQGFHVVEYLLFGDGEDGPNKSIAEFTPRQLQYLSAAAQLLAEYTEDLHRAWTTTANPDQPALPGFIEIITRPGTGNDIYPSEKAVLMELALSLQGIVDEVASAKLADPLGQSLETADPSLVESPFSWNSLQDLTHNMRSVQNVFTGAYGGREGVGIFHLLFETDRQLALAIRDQIIACREAITAIAGSTGMDLRAAILDPQGRARVSAAIDKLNSLGELIESGLLPYIETMP